MFVHSLKKKKLKADSEQTKKPPKANKEYLYNPQKQIL